MYLLKPIQWKGMESLITDVRSKLLEQPFVWNWQYMYEQLGLHRSLVSNSSLLIMRSDLNIGIWNSFPVFKQVWILIWKRVRFSPAPSPPPMYLYNDWLFGGYFYSYLEEFKQNIISRQLAFYVWFQVQGSPLFVERKLVNNEAPLFKLDFAAMTWLVLGLGIITKAL